MSAIEERDRWVVENPADKLLPEKDMLEIGEVYDNLREKTLDCYVDKKFTNGFELDKTMATIIVRTYKPEIINDKEKMEDVDNFTLTTIGDITMLIARNKDMVVQFTVEMPKEVNTVVEEPHFEETLQEFKDEREHYKKISIFGNIIMGIIGAVLIGMCIFILYMEYGG